MIVATFLKSGIARTGVRRGEFDPKVIGIIILTGLLVIVLLIAAKRIFSNLG